MKRKYLLIGSFAFVQLFAKAQTDSVRTPLNKTEIELVYHHYLQDGNNSAVTGGKGTEELSVYGPALTLKKTTRKNTFSFNLGTDIITSASTDNIDYVMSSASRIDARTYANVSYTRQQKNRNSSVNGGVGFSVESDYFSLSGSLGFTKRDKKELRTFSVQLQVFDDDLRWGRLDLDIRKPVKLIYPSELRGRQWFDNYKRKSYNLKTGFTQILNARNILAVFPEVSYQQGLLSTPFHRVYFTNDSVVVERLPDERYKAAVAVKLNTFTGGNVILKNTVNIYKDNFGIIAFSFENETAVKVRSYLTFLPNIRIYTQKSSTYFAGYKEPKSSQAYYTSDYDLSAFQSLNVGLGIKYTPQKYMSRRSVFNSAVLRYNYLHRSNNLNAHILSLVMQTTFFGKKYR
jgi:hypothetical protein